jgi:hypothetical protein
VNTQVKNIASVLQPASKNLNRSQKNIQASKKEVVVVKKILIIASYQLNNVMIPEI